MELDLLKELYKDNIARNDFFKESIFVDGADKVIHGYFLIIRKEIHALLKINGSNR